jgi:aryl-alcohol dehydrogenase-like predicted oxidoreductase
MSYRLAGRTVHRIGFGAMQLPGPGVFGPPRDRDAALAVLRRAVELGVNHIDTAQYYGPDIANELIREALHPYPDDLVLVSKVGGAREEDGAWIPAQRPEQLREGVEENLRSLALERVDVVNLRLMGDEEGEGAPEVPLEDQLAMMVELREEGKIGGIGLSNVTLEQVRAGLAQTEIACVQNHMSLLYRDGEPLLELCREAGIAFVPFFPLGSAFSWIPNVTEQPAVLQVAARIGATPAQVGLAWLLARGPNVLLIPGTSSLAHLEENQAVSRVELDSEALAQLEGVRD